MNENTKKYLYVYGDLDYQIRDRIDVLKKALEDVRNTLGEICEFPRTMSLSVFGSGGNILITCVAEPLSP